MMNILILNGMNNQWPEFHYLQVMQDNMNSETEVDEKKKKYNLKGIQVHRSCSQLLLDTSNKFTTTCLDEVPILPVKKLFVTNLANETTQEDLSKHFKKFGDMSECVIKKNKKSNYAFITYVEEESALEALKRMSNVKGKELTVIPADPRHQPGYSKKQTAVIDEPKSKNIEQNVANSSTEVYPLVHKISDTCLMNVFQYLPVVDRVRVEAVCRRWRELSLESWRTLRRLDVNSRSWGCKAASIETSDLYQVLKRCGRYITTITFFEKHRMMSLRTLFIIGKLCPNLKIAYLGTLEVTPREIFFLLSQCPNLEFLEFDCFHFCDQDFNKIFANSSNLKYVSFEKSNVTGTCLLHLSESVETIVFHEPTRVINYVVFDIVIQKLKNLQNLYLNFENNEDSFPFGNDVVRNPVFDDAEDNDFYDNQYEDYDIDDFHDDYEDEDDYDVEEYNDWEDGWHQDIDYDEEEYSPLRGKTDEEDSFQEKEENMWTGSNDSEARIISKSEDPEKSDLSSHSNEDDKNSCEYEDYNDISSTISDVPEQNESNQDNNDDETKPTASNSRISNLTALDTETSNFKTSDETSGSKTSETSASKKSDETSASKTSETSISKKSDETASKKSDETSISKKSDETSASKKSDETSASKKSDETSASKKSDETSASKKSDETSASKKSDETWASKTSANETFGSKTSENESSASKTSENESSVSKTSENETSSSKMSENEASTSKRIDNEASGWKASANEASGSKASANEDSASKGSVNEPSDFQDSTEEMKMECDRNKEGKDEGENNGKKEDEKVKDEDKRVNSLVYGLLEDACNPPEIVYCDNDYDDYDQYDDYHDHYDEYDDYDDYEDEYNDYDDYDDYDAFDGFDVEDDFVLESNLADAIRKTIMHCNKKLKILQLKRCNFARLASEDLITNIVKFTLLERLDISSMDIVSDELLSSIGANCPKLSVLVINSCKEVTDTGIGGIALLPELKHLSMSRVSKVTGRDLGTICTLKTLYCAGCSSLQEDGLKTLISNCQGLEQLDIQGCELITNALIHLACSATKNRSSIIKLKIFADKSSVDVKTMELDSSLVEVLMERRLEELDSFVDGDLGTEKTGFSDALRLRDFRGIIFESSTTSEKSKED